MRRGVRGLVLLLSFLVGCGSGVPCPAEAPHLAAPGPVVSPPCSAGPERLAFGQTFRLSSAVLGEERVVNVYLPPDYERGDARYPVLYALDGGLEEDFLHVAGAIDVSSRNGVVRPMLVVGIANTERRRDLVGPTTVAEEHSIAPHAGGSDRFRRFLREELQPTIAKRYRVTGASTVVGESFAGLFVVETLLVDPDLFDTYIAIDPSVWWSGGALVRSAADRFAHWTAKPRRLWIATADFKETQDRVAELMASVGERAPAGLTAMLDPLPAEHHATVFPVAELRAYRALFPAAAAP